MPVSSQFLFLHGGGQGSWVWDQTIGALAQQTRGNVRAMALDVPGCGIKRERATEEVAFADIVEELAIEIEKTAVGQVILVGHSQAGSVLPRLAASRPDLFSRLIYVSCIAPEQGLAVHEMAAEINAGANEGGGAAFLDESMPMIDRYRHMFCNDMSDRGADNFLARLGHDNWPPSAYAQREWDYSRVGDVSSTYVLCLRDAILPIDWQGRFAERLGCDRRVFIDAGHQVMNTRPQALAEALLAEAQV